MIWAALKVTPPPPSVYQLSRQTVTRTLAEIMKLKYPIAKTARTLSVLPLSGP